MRVGVKLIVSISMARISTTLPLRDRRNEARADRRYARQPCSGGGYHACVGPWVPIKAILAAGRKKRRLESA